MSETFSFLLDKDELLVAMIATRFVGSLYPASEESDLFVEATSSSFFVRMEENWVGTGVYLRHSSFSEFLGQTAHGPIVN